eukprot:5246569-Pyramimonas_sp.AAC.1
MPFQLILRRGSLSWIVWASMSSEGGMGVGEAEVGRSVEGKPRTPSPSLPLHSPFPPNANEEGFAQEASMRASGIQIPMRV